MNRHLGDGEVGFAVRLVEFEGTRAGLELDSCRSCTAPQRHLEWSHRRDRIQERLGGVRAGSVDQVHLQFALLACDGDIDLVRPIFTPCHRSVNSLELAPWSSWTGALVGAVDVRSEDRRGIVVHRAVGIADGPVGMELDGPRIPDARVMHVERHPRSAVT